MDDSCAVCAENLEWVAYGSCGHREVCSTCVVRLRFIFNDHRCCICKTLCPIVFVTKALGDYTNTITDFSTTFPLEPKEGRVGSLWFHGETKAFFDDLNQYTRIKAMCRLSCASCDKTKKNQPEQGPNHCVPFKSVELLKNHLNHHHKLHMCSLCLLGRKVFICEQKLFTMAQLSQHISSGDSEVDGSESERGGFTGHPMCEFCKIPFYGGNELYTHMSREHYTCHICQRLKPGQYEYYGNYDDLESHFRTDHFLCEDETCLAKKFIVFQIEAELKRHNSIDHGGRVSQSQQSALLQIQASFQYQNSRRERRRSSRREPNVTVLESQASYAVTDGNALLQHVGSSGGSRLGESSSFPPLSVQANRSQSRFEQNTENQTSRLRHQTNINVTSGSSRAWPDLNRFPTQASVTSNDARNKHTIVGVCSSGSSLSSGNAKRDHHHSSSSPKMSLEQPSHSDSPPVSIVQNRRSSTTSAKASNIQVAQCVSDNKSLVEKIRASLGQDEELFRAFKDTSGKYRRGSIDAITYLEYVKGYGLSHLVHEMARLCPDAKRQKELIDSHNAYYLGGRNESVENGGALQSSSRAKENISSKRNKGKAVKVENSSDSRGDSFVDTVRKLQLFDKEKDTYHSNKGKTKVTTLVDSSSAGVRLGKQSKKKAEPELKMDNSKRSQNSTGGLPLRGAWRRGSAKLLL
ncbi:hypothetical protein V5N11_014767 [Cardamine amara subsp. amara]|uniref:RING-type E3 ubiquitin transferase n=1 Tax=Cardamine amara subsp. amara TaxID=228776 RepID=A0ABD0Z3J3_CARAN